MKKEVLIYETYLLFVSLSNVILYIIYPLGTLLGVELEMSEDEEDPALQEEVSVVVVCYPSSYSYDDIDPIIFTFVGRPIVETIILSYRRR